MRSSKRRRLPSPTGFEASRGDVADSLGAAWNRRASEATARLLHHLTDLSRELGRDLASAAASAGLEADEFEELPEPEGAPRPDVFSASMRVEIPRPPRSLARIGPYRRWYVRSHLMASAPRVEEALGSYRKQLMDWTQHVMGEYRRVADATADLCRVAIEGAPGEGPPAADESLLRRDLELLTRDVTPYELASSDGTRGERFRGK